MSESTTPTATTTVEIQPSIIRKVPTNDKNNEDEIIVTDDAGLCCTEHVI